MCQQAPRLHTAPAPVVPTGTALSALLEHLVVDIAGRLEAGDRRALACASRLLSRVTASSWGALVVSPAGLGPRLRRFARITHLRVVGGDAAPPAGSGAAARRGGLYQSVLARLPRFDSRGGGGGDAAPAASLWAALLQLLPAWGHLTHMDLSSAADLGSVEGSLGLGALAEAAPRLRGLALPGDALGGCMPQRGSGLAGLAAAGGVQAPASPLACLADLPELRELVLLGAVSVAAALHLPLLAPRLQQLTIDLSCLPDECAAAVLGRLTGLQSLRLASPQGAALAALAGLPQLTALRLVAADVSMAGLGQLSQVTALTQLELLHCPALQPKNRNVLPLELGSLANLQLLRLDAQLHLYDLRVLALMPSLTHLSVASLHSCVKPEHAPPLARLRSLELWEGLAAGGLRLLGPAGTTPRGVHAAAASASRDAAAAPCAGSPASAPEQPAGTQRWAGMLALMCPGLTRFVCGAATTAALEAVAAHPTLQELHLKAWQQGQNPASQASQALTYIPPAPASPPLGALPHLPLPAPQQAPAAWYVGVQPWRPVPDAWAWVATVPALSRLVIEGADEMLAGVPALALAGLQHVPRLELLGYSCCTDVCLWVYALLLKACGELTIQGAQHLSDGGLLQLANMPGLSSLALRDCPLVTDGGVAALAAAAPGLREVRLQGCARTSPRAQAAVWQGRSRASVAWQR